MDVERVAEELYGLKPAEFVPARDRYVAEARKAKDTAAAKAVAALRRPALAAWAANLLARQKRQEAEQFLAVGETLREAHRTLDGEQLRSASRRRNQLVTALARTAAGLAKEAGQPVSDTVLHEIEQTLHGVLADQDVAEDWSRGRLVKVPEAAVGFGAVTPEAAVLARPSTAEPSPQESGPEEKRKSDPGQKPAKKPARKPAKEPGKKSGVKSGRAEDARRRRELERARTTAGDAEAEADRQQRELAEARDTRRAAAEKAEATSGRVRGLEHELREARQAEQEARAAATKAAEAVTSAERAVRKGRRTAEQAARVLRDMERQPEP
ncbi:hypothetical protein [Streptomyces zaomyceticus]|uniref:hypothetical protein n=1 Tax=Streptomyces zaomyceticus TaxID=68286 RepID=UPI0016762CDB|nr:hypothetical protein [Streptomyces zaomyceticus]